mgnify:CR=1 FL=1
MALPPGGTPTIKSVYLSKIIKCLTHYSKHKTAYLRPTGVPFFYSQLNLDPTRSLTSMDSHSVLTLDSSRDKDKLPKSFILILAKSPLYSRTLVPYPLISDSDIFGDHLGLA